MSDETETGTLEETEFTELGLMSLHGASEMVDQAIEIGIAATEPVEIGDHTIARLVPRGFEVRTFDVREHEDVPRQIVGSFAFVDADSFITYVERYQSPNTMLYGVDPYSSGQKMLTGPTVLIKGCIDDHAVNAPANRSHTANLALRPTEQAKRWGNALSGVLSQEAFLDLIVDGLGEIADPPGADLRDLVSDLHAIRTAEVQSVIRTGGEGSIVVTENVKLHAGVGTTIAFPERMTVTFAPFVDTDDLVVLDLRIKPTVSGSAVSFRLSCQDVATQLSTVCYRVAGAVGDLLVTEVMWTA
jgi:hypothetical protein